MWTFLYGIISIMCSKYVKFLMFFKLFTIKNESTVKCSLQGNLACVNFLSYFALFLLCRLLNLSQNTIFYLPFSMLVFPICSQEIYQNDNSFSKANYIKNF